MPKVLSHASSPAAHCTDLLIQELLQQLTISPGVCGSAKLFRSVVGRFELLCRGDPGWKGPTQLEFL
jgi:hypothetical protein